MLVIAFFNVLSPITFSYAVPWATIGALVVITVVLSMVTTWQPAARVARKPVVDLLSRAT
jgi:ABC-type lipoprotein release transport system permease subunit